MKSHQKKVKLFAFPFAGGSKYSYRVLHDFLPDHFEWETIELPGRGTRIHEALLSDIRETVDDVFDHIKDRITDQEYMIFGHSMGTLLGYELTKKVVASGLPRPVCVFFTGRGGPSVKEKKKISAYDKEAFWKEIKELGGLPEEILNNEEMKDFFEPFLRSDFKAVEDYHYQAMDEPLPIPFFIRTGTEEIILWNDVMKWQDETKFKINLKVLPGDHFFIFKHPEYLIAQIIKAYEMAKATYCSDNTTTNVSESGALQK